VYDCYYELLLILAINVLLLEILNERDHSEDLGLDRRIIFKLNMYKNRAENVKCIHP
jgi:hypothetical protein